MKLTFKKLDPRAVIPTRATAGSAGLDLCACLDGPVTLAVGEIKMIPIGITAQTDSDDIALLIYPRSGLSSNSESPSPTAWALWTATTAEHGSYPS